jgi:hypothetical protein
MSLAALAAGLLKAQLGQHQPVDALGQLLDIDRRLAARLRARRRSALGWLLR